ncbi:MAG: hypothetical protein PHD63_06515 [Candidatus Marinimicrobia bacterium]|nr:hypothetical protein [Candidatus Neomarinimicrobiota bacterium]
MIIMEEREIQKGKWYKAKNKRSPARYVLYISSDRQYVQYDGDEVRFGAKYPKRKMSAFLKWCGGIAKTDEQGYLVGNGHEEEE